MSAGQTRAAIYVRQSHDRYGDELAVTRQKKAARKIAADRGWTVVEVYEDNDKSASKRTVQRPGYDRMAADYAAGRFDAVVCYDLDRLTRQPAQLEHWLEAAEERGLLFVSVTDNVDLSTDNGRMYVRIKIAVARGEIERKAARQRDAAAQRAEIGRPPLGKPPFGYDLGWTVNEAEAETVREAFARLLAGDSIRSLTAWLNDSDHEPRRGRQWWHRTVLNMLQNPHYAAITVHRGKEVGPGTWPAIVDEPTLRAAQHKLSDPRRRNQQGTDRKHLGTGLYRCGKCDGLMVSFSQERYRCGNNEAGRCLSRKRIPVDEYVQAVIRARLARPDVADLLPMAHSADVRKASADVKRLRGRLAQVEEDYDADLIDARRYKIKTEKIAAELATAERAQARAAGDRGLASVVGAANPVAAFDNSPLMIQRAVVDALCTVTLLRPAKPGVTTFDPDSVVIDPR